MRVCLNLSRRQQALGLVGSLGCFGFLNFLLLGWLFFVNLKQLVDLGFGFGRRREAGEKVSIVEWTNVVVVGVVRSE